MKKALLEKAYKEKSLIGIRTNLLDWDESIIGFIVTLEESCFTISEVDEYGFSIGQTIIELDDVITVVTNDRYQKRLKCICENNSVFNPKNRFTVWKAGSDLIPYFNLLIENNKIATLYFDENEYVTGVIIKFDTNYLLINNIGREGDEDGLSCYPIDNFIGLRYDGLEEQKIKLLHESRSKF